MTEKVLKLYEGALNNEEFIEEIRYADNDKPPTIFSDELTKHIFAVTYYGWLVAKYGKYWELNIMQANPVENRVSFAEPNLNCEIEVNGKKIGATPFDMLKILIASFPQGISYDGKETYEHWNKIEKWLNDLLLKASNREARSN